MCYLIVLCTIVNLSFLFLPGSFHSSLFHCSSMQTSTLLLWTSTLKKKSIVKKEKWINLIKIVSTFIGTRLSTWTCNNQLFHSLSAPIMRWWIIFHLFTIQIHISIGTNQTLIAIGNVTVKVKPTESAISIQWILFSSPVKKQRKTVSVSSSERNCISYSCCTCCCFKEYDDLNIISWCAISTMH